MGQCEREGEVRGSEGKRGERREGAGDETREADKRRGVEKRERCKTCERMGREGEQERKGGRTETNNETINHQDEARAIKR